MKKEGKGQTRQVEPPRRSFLRRLWAVLGVLVLMEFVWLVVSFLRPRRPRPGEGEFGTVMAAGRVERFERGSVKAFREGKFYLVRLEDGGFLALSRTCTHLGCTVPWVEEEGRFICPCHSSAFDITGGVISPPAPRPLDIFPVRIEGEIVRVDTTRAVQRKSFEASQAAYPSLLP